jgi:hypothetical protein
VVRIPVMTSVHDRRFAGLKMEDGAPDPAGKCRSLWVPIKRRSGRSRSYVATPPSGDCRPPPPEGYRYKVGGGDVADDSERRRGRPLGRKYRTSR